MKFTKREAIRLCNGCPNKMQEACIFLDIEGTDMPEIEAPACLKRRRQKEAAKNQKSLGAFIDDEEFGQPQRKKRRKQKQSSEQHLQAHHQINPQVKLSFKLDKLDRQILGYIMQGCYRNEIIRETNQPATTIRGRLDKMLVSNIIKKNPESIGFKRLGYLIFNSYVSDLIKQELGLGVSDESQSRKKPEPVKFTKHHCSFKAEIISGQIPKGDKTYSPRNWEGQIFEGGNFVIRVIPNKASRGMAVIDVNIDLGADTYNNLHGKYLSYATKYLGEWAEKHNIRIGHPAEYRKPHVPIEGSRGLAGAILGDRHGEVTLTDYGIRVDTSDEEHKGEVEFTKKKRESPEKFDKRINNFEYVLNQSPEDIAELSKSVNTLRSGVEGIKKEVNNVQQWLIVQRENDMLREQNQLLKDQLHEMSKQLEEIKVAVGITLPKEPKKESSKYDNMGIYG